MRKYALNAMIPRHNPFPGLSFTKTGAKIKAAIEARLGAITTEAVETRAALVAQCKKMDRPLYAPVQHRGHFGNNTPEPTPAEPVVMQDEARLEQLQETEFSLGREHGLLTLLIEHLDPTKEFTLQFDELVALFGEGGTHLVDATWLAS